MLFVACVVRVFLMAFGRMALICQQQRASQHLALITHADLQGHRQLLTQSGFGQHGIELTLSDEQKAGASKVFFTKVKGFWDGMKS